MTTLPSLRAGIARVILRLIALCCAFAFVPCTHARDWYIATTGIDAIGRGSIDQPVRTIEWLLDPNGHGVTWVSDAQPGDVINYRGGTYATVDVDIEIANLTIRAYDRINEPVTLTAPTSADVSFLIQFVPGASGGRIEGLELVGGGYYSLKFESQWDWDNDPFAERYRLGNITVENCRIHDTGRDGIKITPGVSDITIRNCEIFNTGVRDNSNADGIDCVNGTRILVQDCYIHDTASQGLYFKGGSRDCVVERTVFEDTVGAGVILGFYTDFEWFDTDLNPNCYENIRGVVRNCIIRNAGGMGIAFYGAYQAKAYNNTLINVNATNHNSAAIVFCPGTVYGDPDTYYPPNVDPVFVNNIIVVSPTCTTPTAQIRVVDGYPGLSGTPTIRNNRWYRSSGTLTFTDQRTSFSGTFAQWATHIGETGSAVLDPLVDATGHLLAGSPCIGTGDSTAPVVDDFDKQLRSAPFEIGADEIAATAPATYATWRSLNFSGADLTNNAISGPLADPDGAGVTNLQRYAFNLAARGPVAAPATLGTTTSGGSTYHTLTFNRRAVATDLSYVLEGSFDLVTWTPVLGQTYAPGTPASVPARDSVALGTAGVTRRFLRLRVTTP